MRILPIGKHNYKKSYRSANIARRHKLLNLSLVLCFVLSSCSAIKDATSRAQFHKTKNQKDTTNVNVSQPDQISPIKGKVISPFGYRGGRTHTGADIKLQKGDTVRAAYCGRVTKASPYSGYGNLVILKHTNNISTYYAHLSKCLVQVGDSVTAGAVIGLGGHTGRASTDHLHFEVRYNNAPRNPENFFDFNTGAVRILFLAYSPGTKPRNEQSIKIKSEQNNQLTVTENVVTIKKGDTLYALAKQYGTTVKQIQELNNLTSANLRLGMKLKMK